MASEPPTSMVRQVITSREYSIYLFECVIILRNYTGIQLNGNNFTMRRQQLNMNVLKFLDLTRMNISHLFLSINFICQYQTYQRSKYMPTKNVFSSILCRVRTTPNIKSYIFNFKQINKHLFIRSLFNNAVIAR